MDYGAFAALFKGFLWGVLITVFLTNPALAADKKLLVLGDSLTAGYGLPLSEAFPAQLENKLRGKGHAVTVINGGVSGDTLAGGLARLDWMLEEKPDFVIVELGANDMLRVVPVEESQKNMEGILKILQERKIPVLLAGMKAFSNLGPEYAASFETMYAVLARKYDVLFYPFFMDGVIDKKELLQSDGLHPTAHGIAVIVGGIYPTVEKLLEAKNSP